MYVLLFLDNPNQPAKKPTETTNITEVNSQATAPGDVKESSVEAPPVKMPVAKTENKELYDRISNLQLENKLLKSEISSLNEELAGALRTAKNVQDGKHKFFVYEFLEEYIASSDFGTYLLHHQPFPFSNIACHIIFICIELSVGK